MKNTLFVFLLLAAIIGCSKKPVEKPANLISEEKMTDIIYDLSVLEAIRLSNPISLEQRKIRAADYVYKKYQIDSLQFVQSDHYYASDFETYGKIYEKVATRIDNEKKVADSIAKIRREETTLKEKAHTDSINHKSAVK